MFNNEAYQKRLDEIKAEITQSDDQTWLMDVSLRYGRWLAARALEQLGRVVEQVFPAYDMVPDKQKHRDYCAGELMGVVASMHASSTLIRGVVKIADPIGAEASMRIYAEAGFKKGEAAPSAPVAPAVEADDEFRKRILGAAELAGEDSETIASIGRSAGAALAYRGRKYGLLRNGAAVAAAGPAPVSSDQTSEGDTNAG